MQPNFPSLWTDDWTPSTSVNNHLVHSGDVKPILEAGPEAGMEAVEAYTLRASVISWLWAHEFVSLSQKVENMERKFARVEELKKQLQQISVEKDQLGQSNKALQGEVSELKTSKVELETQLKGYEEAHAQLKAEVLAKKAALLLSDETLAAKKACTAHLQNEFNDTMASIFTEHVAGFQKAIAQVQFFLPEADLSMTDVDKEIRNEALVPLAENEEADVRAPPQDNKGGATNNEVHKD